MSTTVAAQPAPPDPEDYRRASELVRDGIASSQAGDHDRAIELYRRAYDLVPVATLLSNIGTEYQAVGQKIDARTAYCTYLEVAPDGELVAYVVEQVKLLQTQLGNEVDDADVCTPIVKPPPLPRPVVPVVVAPPRMVRILIDHGVHQRHVAYVLAGLGGGVIAGSVVLGLVGKHEYDRTDVLATRDRWRNAVRYGGSSMLVVGTGAIAAAVILYLAAPGDETVVRPVATSDQVGVTCMARSSWAVLLLCGGCDAVYGLAGDPGPCDPSSFAAAAPVDLVAAEDFSITRDRSRAVITHDGSTYEVALPSASVAPIDLGVYPGVSFAIAPEGDALFYTASIEPPLLQGAVRSGASWTLGTRVPPGTYAGTPSADEFGPRRVLVRLRDARVLVQEYEDDDGVWRPVGDSHLVDGAFAPNLTPTGLTMVFSAPDPITAAPAVWLATRASLADWFGEAIAILPGDHRSPHLLDACRELYVVDDNQTLRRYDRR